MGSGPQGQTPVLSCAHPGDINSRGTGTEGACPMPVPCLSDAHPIVTER